jgi:hypothetical protein
VAALLSTPRRHEIAGPEATSTPASTLERPPAVVVAPAAPAAAEVAERPRAAEAPAPALSIDIRSSPAGAEVFDGATGRVRGVTPVVLEAARGGAPLALHVKKAGYRAQDISVPLERDAVIQLQLVRQRPVTRRTATDGLDSL